MSGKALAAGTRANPQDQEPVASAIPLTYFSNDAHLNAKPSIQTCSGGAPQESMPMVR